MNQKIDDLLKSDQISKIKFFLFYFAYSIELMILLVDKSALTNPFEGRLFQITFVLFLLAAATNRYTIKEVSILFVFGLIGTISYLTTGRNEIIRIVIFLAACKEIPVRNLVKYTFYVVLIGISFLVVLSLTGVMGVVSITDDFGRGVVETRYALGIGHPNALHCMVWSLVVLYLYLYDHKMKWWAFLLLGIGNGLLYLLTISKAGVIITYFTILVAFFFHYFTKLRTSRLVLIGSILLTLGCIGFSIFSAIPNTFLTPESKIDRMLTGRLWLARLHGGTDQWSMFSNPDATFFFDMGYVRMFYWYGIIPGILAVALLCILLYGLWKNNDYSGFMLVLSFIVYTTVEAHSVSEYLARNYVLLIAGTGAGGIIKTLWRNHNDSDKS